MESIYLIISAIVVLALVFATLVRIVPQNNAYVVEKLGKFDRVMEAGFHMLLPFIERVAYKHSLKEFAIDVPAQQAITKDNVALRVDGVLYLRIMDPRKASYGVERLRFAIMQLAQTTMRAELGKLSLDQTFESRENVNTKVTSSIDEASESWGTKVLRYEIKDISPPSSILEEMEKQMSAERERRVAVTTSEGYRQAQINQAEGDRQAIRLRAEGNAQAVKVEAQARADAIRMISEAINAKGGTTAVAQQLSEQYINAFEKLAREGTVALLPGDSADISGIVSRAFTAFETLRNQIDKNGRGTED